MMEKVVYAPYKICIGLTERNQKLKTTSASLVKCLFLAQMSTLMFKSSTEYADKILH